MAFRSSQMGDGEAFFWVAKGRSSGWKLRSCLEFIEWLFEGVVLGESSPFPLSRFGVIQPYFCSFIASTMLTWAFFKLVKWWNNSLSCFFWQDVRLRTFIRPLPGFAKALRTSIWSLNLVDKGLFVCIYWLRNFPKVLCSLYWSFGNFRKYYAVCMSLSEFSESTMRSVWVSRNFPKVLCSVYESFGTFRKCFEACMSLSELSESTL